MRKTSGAPSELRDIHNQDKILPIEHSFLELKSNMSLYEYLNLVYGQEGLFVNCIEAWVNIGSQACIEDE